MDRIFPPGAEKYDPQGEGFSQIKPVFPVGKTDYFATREIDFLRCD